MFGQFFRKKKIWLTSSFQSKNLILLPVQLELDHPNFLNSACSTGTGPPELFRFTNLVNYNFRLLGPHVGFQLGMIQ